MLHVGTPEPVLARAPAAPLSRVDYARTVRELSERLILIQRPIRVLDAMRWDASIQWQFFADRCERLPRITRESYDARTLGFDPARKHVELADLEREIRRRLPGDDPAARLIANRCRQYGDAVRLLEARGTPEFARLSRRIYGSTLQPQTNRAAIERVLRFLEARQHSYAQPPQPDENGAEQAAEALAQAMRCYFGSEAVKVKVVDNLVADAAAGCDYLKLRRAARFSTANIRLLEVHEAWVHLGTTLNGRGQPILTCLSKAAPGTTRSQEGLAVLTEFLTGADHPARVRRLLLRLRGLALAEQGADFLEVFRFFREQGCACVDAYQQTSRLFRGSLPSGVGPFTKDIAYGTGLQMMAKHVRSALKGDAWPTIGLLFCGKTSLEELPTLSELRESGWIAAAEFVPPPFQNRATLQEAMRRLEGL